MGAWTLIPLRSHLVEIHRVVRLVWEFLQEQPRAFLQVWELLVHIKGTEQLR